MTLEGKFSYISEGDDYCGRIFCLTVRQVWCFILIFFPILVFDFLLSFFVSCCGLSFPPFQSFYFLLLSCMEMTMLEAPTDAVMDLAPYSMRTYMDGINGWVYLDTRRFGLTRYCE